MEKENNLFKFKQNFNKINNDINNKNLFSKEHLFILIFIIFLEKSERYFLSKNNRYMFPT